MSLFFTKKILALILIFALALFLRSFRLPELAKFNYDEARDSLTELTIVRDHNLTLLGPETRIGDKIIYFGPLHYYLMAPALYLGHLNPLGPYFWTAILGALTIIPIYLTRHKLNSALFYAVFPLAVIYNRWAWNPNTIPLFASLFLLALIRRHYFFAGIFVGLAAQLHITAGALGVLALILIFKNKENIARNSVKVLIGIATGLLPMIIFDLRHSFLYLKGYLSLLNADTHYRSFNFHYLFWAFPLGAYALGSIPRNLTYLLTSVSLAISCYWLLSAAPDLARNPQTQNLISEKIAEVQSKDGKNFNVVSFVDTDARATPYRYFLAVRNVHPLNYDEYPISDVLYVISKEDGEKLLYNNSYEIGSFKPKFVTKMWEINGEVLYKLTKN